ncbi:hypothetical protein [Lysinibacillus cavernae]|uniref:hypothetical protein n=1 Tax=Lysinibacillus cavernae TaxID=2666135 RepID=UPI0012D97F18|nr:hypothetical protein [Lysinibacillus cavernae]
MNLLTTFLSGGLSVLFIILPVMLLMAVEIGCIIIFSSIFEKLLPHKIYKSLLVCVALAAFYIWAVPMNMGYSEFFRATF